MFVLLRPTVVHRPHDDSTTMIRITTNILYILSYQPPCKTVGALQICYYSLEWRRSKYIQSAWCDGRTFIHFCFQLVRSFATLNVSQV